jgi:DNA repair exonuclease SbcCD ATPase subunit
MLLRKLIPQMQQLMNDFMKGFVNFQIQIEIKDMDLEFRIHRISVTGAASAEEYRDYNILLLSGFERFITQISLRLAMYQLGMLPRCGMFFVDEGINCFDKENITKVSSLFEQILYRYQAFLLITHLEQVKDSINHFLEIEDHVTYSHIEAI